MIARRAGGTRGGCVDTPRTPVYVSTRMLPLTRHGWREMLIGSLAFVIVMSVALEYVPPAWWWVLLVPFALLLVFVFAFFRDPNRPIPTEQYVMVSPADGTVSDITEIPHDPLLNGPAVRVGIFLSVFNVHVNRCPCDGRVVAVEYKKGKFINALKHNQASEENESNTIVLAEPQGEKRIAVVKQIVGLIARRIIFTARQGDVLRRGERIGMIKFGSRTELSIPKWMEPEIRVKEGDTVRGGADVIAVLGKPIATTQPARKHDEDFEPIIGRDTPA